MALLSAFGRSIHLDKRVFSNTDCSFQTCGGLPARKIKMIEVRSQARRIDKKRSIAKLCKGPAFEELSGSETMDNGCVESTRDKGEEACISSSVFSC